MPATRTLLCASLCALFLTACGSRKEPIRQYTTQKPTAVFAANHTMPADSRLIPHEWRRRSLGPRRRMLAAMIIGKEWTWFLKITGVNKDLKNDLPPKFYQLVQSWRVKDGKPTWKSPDGWKQLAKDDPKNKISGSPGGIDVVATIQFGGPDDLLRITRMPTPKDLPEIDWIFPNVNRWRRQMNRIQKSPPALFGHDTPESEEGDLDETRKLVVDGRTVVLVQMNTPAD